MSTVVAASRSTTALPEGKVGTSPRVKARVAGALYLITVVAGVFVQSFISDKLVVAGDAAATAANLLANQSLFQAGLTIYLIEMICQVAMIAVMYGLLKPAGRSLAAVGAALMLTGAVIKTFSRVFYIAPLLVLGGAPYLSVFSPPQLQAL